MYVTPTLPTAWSPLSQLGFGLQQMPSWFHVWHRLVNGYG